MSDFEAAVAKAHAARVAAGYSWAQPRVLTAEEIHDAAKLPHEWISPPKQKPLSEQRRVRIYSVRGPLAIVVLPLSRMKKSILS